MAVRFRIRTSAGQELSFASHEMFEDFVRSGDLAPDDLVYDADTESWSSARTHPIVLEIEYDSDSELEAAADEAETEAAADRAGGRSESEEPSTEDPARAGESASAEAAPDSAETARRETTLDDTVSIDDGFGLDLAPPPDPKQQEEAREFVERMEAERDAALRGDVQPSVGPESRGGTMADLGSVGDTLAPRPEAVPLHREPRERAREDTGRFPVPLRDASPARVERKGRSGAASLVGLAIVVLALGGAGGYAGFRLVNAVPAGGSVVDPAAPVEPIAVEAVEAPSPPTPLIEATPAAVTERARERFLTAARNEMRNLPPIPDVWPTGRYLSLPSEYPLVADVWQSYLHTMRAVRARDVERYVAAYESALDDAHVHDESRVVRFNRAMADFQARAIARDAHYDRVEALAIAAIQSHNALIGAEGLILYDENGLDDDAGALGVGTSSRDEDSPV